MNKIILLLLMTGFAVCGGVFPMPQPDIPKSYKIIESPADSFPVNASGTEQKRGWITFNRPPMEPVFPGTRPRPGERLKVLRGFAAKGEFETMPLTIYPLRKLENLKISVSDLICGRHRIAKNDIQIRLVTYWYINYPRYVSRNTCMRMPEFLEPLKSNNITALEAQRYFITVKTPANISSGIYTGTVKVSCGSQDQTMPVQFRVLTYQLKQDPNKRFGTYYSGPPHSSIWSKGHDKAWIKQATINDYKAMRDYGINNMPTIPIGIFNGKIDFIPTTKWRLELMREAGLKGPVPVPCWLIEPLYRKFTGKKMGGHLTPTAGPVPEKVYLMLDKMLEEFAARLKKGNYPECVFCPIDEISSKKESMEIGTRLYKLFKKHGLKTYATKNPLSRNAEMLAPYVDYWCSQPYVLDYQKITSDKQHKYWCYPNHNAYEIKDPLTMSKGGRMTYGYGFWRSGYSMLIPYTWRGLYNNHLLKRGSSGGNFLANDGSVIMTTYWECFREGIDDGRYIYTLQDALVKREGSKNPKLQKLVKEGKRLLQQIWDSIYVQNCYLRDNMWASQEFDIRRWQMACLTEKLLAYAPLNDHIAASVIVDPASGTKKRQLNEINFAADPSIIQQVPLADFDFNKWHYRGDGVKGALSVKNGIAYWNVNLNPSRGPGAWPRLQRGWRGKGLDISGYDFLSMQVRINSNRNEVEDDFTPIQVLFKSKNGISALDKIVDAVEENSWFRVMVPMKNFYAKIPVAEQKQIALMMIALIRSDFKSDNTEINIEIKSPSLLRLKRPVIFSAEIPELVYAGNSQMKYKLDLLGKLTGYQLKTTLNNAEGQRVACDIIQPECNSLQLSLSLRDISCGQYKLVLQILDKAGQIVGEKQYKIKAINSPWKADQ